MLFRMRGRFGNRLSAHDGRDNRILSSPRRYHLPAVASLFGSSVAETRVVHLFY